jgi:uncharacterized protein DUF6282
MPSGSLQSSPESRALMQGAVDTHVHSAPDLVERKLDDFELARQARERGMVALVLKNHFFSTALRAPLVESQVPGIRLIGSIVLNQPSGGMNPWAVEAAARGGARVVWMPTFQAENQVAFQRQPGKPRHTADLALGDREPGVRIFGSDGSLLPDAEAVLEIIRDRGMVLASGHLGPDEVDRLTGRAQAIGLRKIILTHPEFPAISMPVELQKRLVERGVYFERTFNLTLPPYSIPVADLATTIRDVGYERTILATDFGQAYNPLPVEGFEAYIQGLLDHGFSAGEIRRMASENARGLLDV